MTTSVLGLANTMYSCKLPPSFVTQTLFYWWICDFLLSSLSVANQIEFTRLNVRIRSIPFVVLTYGYYGKLVTSKNLIASKALAYWQ
jgi:hypothetical protein